MSHSIDISRSSGYVSNVTVSHCGGRHSLNIGDIYEGSGSYGRCLTHSPTRYQKGSLDRIKVKLRGITATRSESHALDIITIMIIIP